MAVSTRTRFEIFKRDRFTCHYCGRTPPQVLLEVDHILPRAAGGTDDAENLITSCQDCNRGKSANLLEEGQAPSVSAEATDELAERIEQARQYAELMQIYRRLEQANVQRVTEAWAEAFGATSEEHEDGSQWWDLGPGETWPREASVRTILRRLPLHVVLEAVDIAAAWADGWSYDRTVRYFYGVCWRHIRELDGRA